MILKRIITGVSIAVIVAVIIWLGDPWLTIAACIISALAAFEFYRIVKCEHIQPLTYPGIFFSILFVLNSHISHPYSQAFLLALIILVLLIWVLFKQDKDNAFINVAWTITGIFYTGFLLSFYISMRNFTNGMGWLFLVLTCTALCDVAAYAFGSWLGKHPLAVSVSPHKTIEGSIAGLIASILFAVLLGIFFKLPVSYLQMVITGVVIAVFAQIGDLVESLLKRNMKAKDTGYILPGHGGILDRIDSHLLVAPVAYFLVLLLTKQG